MLRSKSSTGGVLNLVKRLFSSSNQQLSGLPPTVLEQLAVAPFAVQKFNDAGRGLVAARDIQYGEVLLTEQPYVCCPSLSNRRKVCYHCLKVLPTPQQQAAGAAEMPISSRSHMFCSSSCLSSAQASYFTLESQLSLEQLERHCQAYGERFPLIAARLALMIAQDGMTAAAQQQQQGSDSQLHPEAGVGRSSTDVGRISRISRMSTGSTGSSRWSHTLATSSMRSSNNLGTTSWQSSSSSNRWQGRPGSYSTKTALGPAGHDGSVHQQVASALGFLCFANVPPPPPGPWAEAHKMLARALAAAAGNREQEEEAAGLQAALQGLDLDWYVAVMARLHLNTFKVEAALPIDWSQGHAAAAAMLGGDAASAGSALYLLGSLFNHSCEPNVHVTFPGNDSTAVFTAARQIAEGEQLFITYIDAGQELDARQEYLAFAYGFRCHCVRCCEELEEQAKHMPPQLP